MPYIRITQQTVAQGRNVRPGDVLEVTAREARQLFASRKAQPEAAPTAPVKTTKPYATRKAKP